MEKQHIHQYFIQSFGIDIWKIEILECTIAQRQEEYSSELTNNFIDFSCLWYLRYWKCFICIACLPSNFNLLHLYKVRKHKIRNSELAAKGLNTLKMKKREAIQLQEMTTDLIENSKLKEHLLHQLFDHNIHKFRNWDFNQQYLSKF